MYFIGGTPLYFHSENQAWYFLKQVIMFPESVLVIPQNLLCVPGN